MAMTHKKFAATLVEYRTRNNFSQRDAGLALGCSKRTLQNWEQERAMPQGFGLNAILKIIQDGQARAAQPKKPKRVRATRRKKP
jgi:DNA-binding transcriptional regulator YiaG